ncbi:MAG: ATP-dependent RecD-like DNA helicase [Firmicutes bacterium]|nr:ATP-dependent RecD-like DNA helicase [Bacillota bacterium]
MEERTGTIAEIIFRNEENGYTVAVMETETEYFTVVGNLPVCHKGARFKLRGTFKQHSTYGEQFAFTEFEEVMPTGIDAIFDFLSSGMIKGVGPSTAANLISAFGEDTLRIIDEEPEKLTTVKGIGDKTAETIRASFAERREFAKVSLAFQEYGISAAQAMRLYKAYGADALAIIEENPYRLIDEVPGFGFKKADQIGRMMGVTDDSPFRVNSGIRFALQYAAGEGNTYLPRERLKNMVSELLDVSGERIDEGIVELAFDGGIKVDSLDGEDVCYLFSYYAAELRVVANLIRISGATLKPIATNLDNMIRQAEVENGIELSVKQKRAVTASVADGVSVITGGPGTGKTTIINAIINIFEKSGLKTAIAAPTGRAARRITETSGRFAQTIHRLLEYYYSEEIDDMRFKKNADDQLDYDVILIDEASMIDVILMAALTDAIKTGTRLILIGDSDQLPSVGAGNVLHDVIDSEFVGVTRLTEIFRQAEESLIVVNAHRINKGEYPYVNEKGKDFFFMETNGDSAISDLVVDLVERRLPAYYSELDPKKDIQVLTPTRKNELGTVALNKLLQSKLNPPAPDKPEKKHGDRIFRQGDKVMQIRNNYQIGWRRRRDFSEGEGIFNGDMGYISNIDNEYGKVTVIFDEDRYVEYDAAGLEELELAYALTVHKSQGSEFPVVVMPITNVPPMLATRNLLYTAVTRGKKAVVLCGSFRRVQAMVDNNSIKERYSGLRARLAQVLSGEKKL